MSTDSSNGPSPAAADALADRRPGLTAKISTGVVKLLSEFTGRGPTQAKTLISGDLVTVVLRDSLTRPERRLEADGRGADVLRTRHTYQETMHDDLVALVERETRRRVTAFISANHLEPDIAVELFFLDRPLEGG